MADKWSQKYHTAATQGSTARALRRHHPTTPHFPGEKHRQKMGAAVQFSAVLGVSSPALAPSHCSCGKKQSCSFYVGRPRQQQRGRRLRVRAVQVGAPGGEPSAGAPEDEDSAGAPEDEEAPSVDFAFVSPRLLPDGTPDVHYRTACGGQKLRDIMLNRYIDLYGPYDKLLLNCSGGGVCGTCIVEVVAGKEMLSPKTDVEKELLKRKPKTWRLACQATVGNPDSTGQMIIQQLPEWKIHEWDK